MQYIKLKVEWNGNPAGMVVKDFGQKDMEDMVTRGLAEWHEVDEKKSPAARPVIAVAEAEQSSPIIVKTPTDK